jgi:hypothetical protein
MKAVIALSDESGNAPSDAAEEMDAERDDGDDEKDVNDPANDFLEEQESEKPENHENDCSRKEHVPAPKKTR